jgi:hypothetical protein
MCLWPEPAAKKGPDTNRKILALSVTELYHAYVASLKLCFMLVGHLDSITSSKFVEGWAYDTDAPVSPLTISLVNNKGDEIGWGLAHLFREDLAASGHGCGWCAFRVRTESSITKLRKSALVLAERTTRKPITVTSSISFNEDSDAPLSSVTDITACDPTMINSVSQLLGCDELFNGFIRARGVNAFVRATYVYILGRPADPNGLDLYAGLIRSGAIKPFRLLEILSDSEEFHAKPRLLGAPNMPGFPFKCD